ncbi:MAG: TauD/TfdA family dioxygenase [Rhodospirillaceae bacterium]|jgi:taurine dioxygenase|nr:TauD/TfdA family dioxygenase [Rhodospirillaceae bacterium]MBT5514684.1 TauD/TfdA family dioxygenase [Rhodospirillaceae bacterium]MBT6609200.1 TauD/TfdA family dioxygenase [Rhodospirillaceae bacterium]MBT6885328.1 TauD/TfdA family dioxygenase [Rhodospirillaceae bacterium]MBT7250593.1 TauD/TfdA family dioxygenase [Rhodospirillaceae bacterium]
MEQFDLSVEPRDHALAATVHDIDLSQDLDEAVIAAIRAAWMKNPVLVFPGQTLTPEQHLAYSRRFGDLQGHTVKNILHPEYPEILVLSNRGRGGTAPINNGGAYWHSDITYEEIPPMGSILYGFEVPPEDGDTLYADMTAAYEALDGETKGQIDGTIGIHTYRNRHLAMVEAGVRPAQTEEQMAKWADVEHPVVRTHPETGRKALYINEGFTNAIKGLAEDEGRQLLDRLCAHATEDRFVYRHQWQPCDVVMWDNRCTMHRATTYDLSYERSMHRTTIRGIKPA